MSKTIQQRVQILPIAAEHIEGFHQCLDAVARERRHLGLVEAFPPDATRASALKCIAEGVPRFVALLDGEVVGWCDVFPLKLEGFRHRGDLGMGVYERFRHMGIGEQLLRRTIQAAKEMGLERIDLEVYASNVPAIRLYQKIGFGVEGVKKRGRKLDGQYDDIIDMVLFV
jgi:ribosomal protein S18 acetylase RimI-like enzyme